MSDALNPSGAAINSLMQKLSTFIALLLLTACTVAPTDSLSSTSGTSGATRSNPANVATSTADAYPIPQTTTSDVTVYPPPSSGIEPTLRPTDTSITKPTLTHAPTPTVTIAPTVTISAYTGSPFSIVFNDGNLWLKEIGSELERQLTHEPEGWFINQFAINHTGDQIAYLALKRDVDIVDGMIKLVDLQTGEVRPLLGMGDGLIENRLKWLDQTHLAFSYEGFGAYPMETPLPPPAPEVYHPFFYSVFDLTTGETKPMPQAVDISQSPDGRYLLTCTSSYHYEPDCEFRLHDLTTNQIELVAEDTNFGWFRGWSSDSQWMLFENALYGEVTNQKYMIVNAHSLNSTWALGTGQACDSTAWAFQSAVFACTVCEGEKGCQVRFYGPDGFQARPPISLPGQYYLVSWTPDDTRLLLYSEAHTLWVINADGTGLQQVFRNVVDWAVLPTGNN